MELELSVGEAAKPCDCPGTMWSLRPMKITKRVRPPLVLMEDFEDERTDQS